MIPYITSKNKNVKKKKPQTKKKRVGNYIPSYYLDLPLTKTEIYVLFLIHVLGKKYLFKKTNNWLAYKTGVSKRQIQKIVKKLEEKEYLNRIVINKNARKIRSNFKGGKPMGSIPSSFINLDITITELKILGLIYMMTRKGKPFFATNKWIQRRIGVSTRTIGKSIKVLESKGFISVAMINNNKRVIRMNEEFIKKEAEKSRKSLAKTYKKPCKKYEIFFPKVTSSCSGGDGLNFHPYIEKENRVIAKAITQRTDDTSRIISSLRKREEKNRSRAYRTLARAAENRKGDSPASTSLKQGVKSKGINYKIKTKEPFVSKKTNELLSIWNNSGLRKHNNPRTKIYSQAISCLKALARGTFFDNIEPYGYLKGRKFSKREFLDSVSRFRLAALDPTFEPIDPKIKNNLAKFSLPDFLFNPRTGKSWFVECLEKTPRLHILPYKQNDEYPQTTKCLKDMYIDKVLSGAKPKNGLSVTMERKFILAAKQLEEFFDYNKDRLKHPFVIKNGYKDKCRLLWESLIEDIGDPAKITPGHFASEYTFAHRLPAYLNYQGILNEPKRKKDAIMNIYDFKL